MVKWLIILVNNMIFIYYKREKYHIDYYARNQHIGYATILCDPIDIVVSKMHGEDVYDNALFTIHIFPLYRMKGYGTYLLKYIQQFLKYKKYQYLNIYFPNDNVDNQVAIQNWFIKHNFKIYGNIEMECDLLTIKIGKKDNIIIDSIDSINEKVSNYITKYCNINNMSLQLYIIISIEFYIQIYMKDHSYIEVNIFDEILYMLQDNSKYNVTILNDECKMELIEKTNIMYRLLLE
jgi:hypothetical protein